MFTVPITLVARTVTGQDSDGNDIYTPTQTEVQGVYAPGGSTEVTVGGDQVVSQPTVYLPPPAPAEVDAVQIFGLQFEVDGQPADWSLQPHPFSGWIPSLPVIVRLKKVDG